MLFFIVKTATEEFCASKHLCLRGSVCSTLPTEPLFTCFLCHVAVHDSCGIDVEVKPTDKKMKKTILKTCWNCIATKANVDIINSFNENLMRVGPSHGCKVNSGLDDFTLQSCKRIILKKVKDLFSSGSSTLQLISAGGESFFGAIDIPVLKLDTSSWTRPQKKSFLKKYGFVVTRPTLSPEFQLSCKML